MAVEGREEDAEIFVKELIPLAILISKTGNNFIYNVQMRDKVIFLEISAISGIFDENSSMYMVMTSSDVYKDEIVRMFELMRKVTKNIENIQEQGMILDWSYSASTLEDVFMNIAR
jgi:hypothetical protein